MTRMIRVSTIGYGWLTMEFGPHLVCCSDFIGLDTPRILLERVADILDDPSREGFILWPNEPGAAIMRVCSGDGKISLSLFGAEKETTDISPEEDLRELCAEPRWTVTLDIKELVNDLTVDFSLYEGGSGRSLYEQHWMPFPDGAFRRLKEHAFRLQEQVGKYESDLLITTYTQRD